MGFFEESPSLVDRLTTTLRSARRVVAAVPVPTINLARADEAERREDLDRYLWGQADGILGRAIAGVDARETSLDLVARRTNRKEGRLHGEITVYEAEVVVIPKSEFDALRDLLVRMGGPVVEG